MKNERATKGDVSSLGWLIVICTGMVLFFWTVHEVRERQLRDNVCRMHYPECVVGVDQ